MARHKQPQTAYVQPFDTQHREPIAAESPTNHVRLTEIRDAHFWHYREDVVRSYATFADPIPNPTAIWLMGLAEDAARIEAVTSMKDAHPFPGVRIGPGPGLHAAPDTSPRLGGFDHLRFHAHER